jgi:solute carrier family 35 protein C2
MSDPHIGVRDAVAKETDFELRGFILVMLAAVMSGFRWTVTQLLLQVVSKCSVLMDIF